MKTFKILIVDDQESNILSLVASLESPLLTFLTATSGQEALKILAKTSDVELALLDVQMPEMNGFELATLMRGVDKTKHIPIMFLTANIHSADFEFKGYDAGATDILFKPVNIQILKSKIDVFRRLREKRLSIHEKVILLEKVTQDLVAARQIAEEADRAKSAFLANMSHEIRTPMSSILGFADLVKQNLKDQEKAVNYVDIIIRNGKHLLDIINDVLDLSKVEAGQLNVDVTNVNLKNLVDEVILVLSGVARANSVDLRTGDCFKEDIYVLADSVRLKQVLINLVGNAIKFSNGGKVLVDCSVYKEDLEIIIQDTGIGIPLEKQNKLFVPFSQLTENNSELTLRGTGLGLCLSKKLMQNMGGDVYLHQSKANEGSIFKIRTVLGDATAAEFSPIHRKSRILGPDCLKKVSIFVVDDSHDNQMLLQIMLSKYGAQLEFADNGQIALDRLEEKSFDIILMDYKMPVMDGFETTKSIRRAGSKVPIILLTANAMKGEREKSFKAGADAYISKPIDWNALINCILNLLNH